MKLNGQTTFREFEDKLVKKPGYKEVHEKLGPEFRLYQSLIEARIDKKLTQKQLAQRLGIAQSALARFESGRTNPTLSFLRKITSGLGLKITIM